jgi:hypothetical protein
MHMQLSLRGLNTLQNRMRKIAAATETARLVALRSTGKMVRQTALQMARGISRSGVNFSSNELGWPVMSPFSRTIAQAKGARRDAFNWAKDQMSYQVNGVGGKTTRSAAGTENFFFSDAGRSRNSSISRILTDRYGSVTRKSRDGMFTIADSRNLAKMRKDAEWQSHMTREREKALKRQLRLANGKRSRKNGRSGISAQLAPMLKLMGLVRYVVDESNGSVTIGFFRESSDKNTDRSIENLVQKNQRGFTTTITRKMRRFFHGIGYHVSGKTTITTPPRPWIPTVWQRVGGQVSKHFEVKYREYLKKFTGSAQ